ncbi:Hypothetical protein PBC10988_5570 [Planctomycetales bacterium 10988]|nr:Hypothetical protein PBC10988_5570 [Planctomycetales bacterium 10988]
MTKIYDAKKIFKYSLLLSLGLCLGAILPATVSAQNVIQITNIGSQPIWVTVAFEKKNLVQSDSGVTADREFETHLKFAQEDSIGFEGLEASSSREIDMGGRVRRYDSSFLKEKFDWSPFIQAGESKIGPGYTESFGVSEDKNVYYLSVRRQSGILKVNVPKLVSVHNRLTINNDGYESPRERTLVTSGTSIYLKSQKNGSWEYITTPYKHGTFGDAVAMLNTNAGAIHSLVAVDGSTDPIKNGDLVYIKVNSNSAYDRNRLYMLHGAYDNIYYTNDTRARAAQWEVIKVRDTNSRRDPFIRTGTLFQLVNREHRNKGLSVQSNDGWLHSYENRSNWQFEVDE